jgi:ribokinase
MTAPATLVVGDVATDIVAIHHASITVDTDTSASITMAGGGAAANTAAWLAACGMPVELVAVVGTDRMGAERVAELAALGVGCRHIRRIHDAPTGSVIVLVHDRNRTMLCDRGANLHLSVSDVDAALSGIGAGAHLHLSGYVLLDEASRDAGRYALGQAHRCGLTTSVDAASSAPLRRVGAATFLDWISETDLLVANLDEAHVLAGDVAANEPPEAPEPLEPAGPAGPAEAAGLARALTASAHRVVVKLGAAGALWADRDGTLADTPAHAVPVVDPTGAGDAFAAGLLNAWLAGAPPAEALAHGAQLGALAVSTVGARPSKHRSRTATKPR